MIGVVGASGFVGAAVVERLLQAGEPVRPLIHCSGNAWRIGRFGVAVQSVDILCKHELHAALRGCTRIINCARGPSQVMLDGLRNLLAAAAALGVERFVHISSTAVFGERFPGRPVDESFQGRAHRGTYGWTKLQQDALVERAHRKGLPCAVVCPPNIGGPYSPFLLKLIETMRGGHLALVDAGASPCSMVDIDNLVDAIVHALELPTDGRRVVVCDQPTPSWREVVIGLCRFTAAGAPVPITSADEARQLVKLDARPRRSMTRALRHLASSEVRAALRRDPFWASAEAAAKTAILKLPRALRSGLVNGHARSRRAANRLHRDSGYDTSLLAQQLRAAEFACERARRILQYEPRVTPRQSLEKFSQWYVQATGFGTPEWELTRLLN